MNHAEHIEAAAAAERIACCLDADQALAGEALHFAAQLLRHDERQAHAHLTRLLNRIEIGELLSAASVRLELEAVTGNVDARRAAGHIAAAGIILYPSETP
jgi:hypothetical protein